MTFPYQCHLVVIKQQRKKPLDVFATLTPEMTWLSD